MKKDYIEYLKKYLPSDELEDGIRKLNEGISPQYIVGNVDFYGNTIYVNSDVLIPRFETELLVEKSINYIKSFFGDDNNIRILDIGTGSGCIAIALSKEFGYEVVGCDISYDALKVASRNVDYNHVDVSLIYSDLFSNIDSKFDVIISNPPYIGEDEEIEDIVLNNEPRIALFARENGLYFYSKILSDASKYLNNKFMICFEIGQFQGEDIKGLAYRYLGDVNVLIEKDYSHRDRFVFIFSK